MFKIKATACQNRFVIENRSITLVSTSTLVEGGGLPPALVGYTIPRPIKVKYVFLNLEKLKNAFLVGQLGQGFA